MLDAKHLFHEKGRFELLPMSRKKQKLKLVSSNTIERGRTQAFWGYTTIISPFQRYTQEQVEHLFSHQHKELAISLVQPLHCIRKISSLKTFLKNAIKMVVSQIYKDNFKN